jgi:S1-C subfamily serine protease
MVLAAVAAALVLLSAGAGLGWTFSRGGVTGAVSVSESTLTPAPQITPSQGSSGGAFDVAAIADRVDDAVVDVNTVIDENPFDNVPAEATGAGTGMVITSSGLVMTNNHVVRGATKIEVVVPGRSGSYTATVVGAAPSADVALLQIEGLSGLPTVTVADSSTLSVGQDVIAIGNAFGRGGSPTVSQGEITALGRSISVSDGQGGSSVLANMIEIDADIHPGESGGPLVNSTGQVIGIITAGTRNGATADLTAGYAIPSTGALAIVNEIRAGHENDAIIIGEPGYLGIGAQELDAQTAAELGVDQGIVVTDVTAGTPADRAGITANSVITAIDGEVVSTMDELGVAIHQHGPGEQIRVTWVDSDGRHTATVRLVAGPAV